MTFNGGGLSDLMKQAQQMQEALPKEREMLLSRVPEWSDEKAAETETAELVNYLTADGFSADDINVASHNGRLLAMAVKAMRYDSAKSKSTAIKKKLVKIPPKILKPGASQGASNASEQPKDRAEIMYGS